MSTSSDPDPAAGRDEIETTRLALVPKKLDEVRAEIKAMDAGERAQLSPARVLTRCGFQLLGEVVDPEDPLVWRWETARPADAAAAGNRDLAR